MIPSSEKNFDFENNDSKGKIMLVLESPEIIKIKILDNNNNINYESIFNLDNLKKKNKHFQVCSISEIYEILSKNIENNNYTLEKTVNSIILKIPIEFCFSKTDAEFEIISEDENKDVLIQKLLTEKKDIEYQLNIMQIEQREIKEKINLILEKLDILTNNQNIQNNLNNLNIQTDIETKEIKDISTDIDSNNLNNDEFEKIMKSSKIIDQNSNQIFYIKNWISPNKNIKCKLIYDGKRDGGQSSIFHSLCDNKGPSITFIKTNNKRRIGGFTMKNWDINANKFISDDKAFIFDLDLNEKYDIVKKENAIYSCKGYGPTFGGHHDIYLGENFCTDEKSADYCHYDSTYYKYSSNIKNHNTVNFICEEIEVFQIIFNN